MDSKSMEKVSGLLADKLNAMLREELNRSQIPEELKFLQFLLGPASPSSELAMVFRPLWDEYLKGLTFGSSFVNIQDPWDQHREIPVSTEVAEKALVLGGFP